MSSHNRSKPKRDNLYFAYGSNLCLSQMAQRCPSSFFVGKATLHDYRWQINERGVANVVGSQGSAVIGLIYSISPKDEKTLDRNEGVSKGFYEKRRLLLHVQPGNGHGYKGYRTTEMAHLLKKEESKLQDHLLEEPNSSSISKKSKISKSIHLLRQGLGKPSRRDIDGHNNPQSRVISQSSKDHEHQSRQKQKEQMAYQAQQRESLNYHKYERPEVPQAIEALVYMSSRYIIDGPIREEYVVRMERAMSDAIKLGISKSFVNGYMKPIVHGPVMPPKLKQKQRRFQRSSEVTKEVNAGSNTASNTQPQFLIKHDTPREHRKRKGENSSMVRAKRYRSNDETGNQRQQEQQKQPRSTHRKHTSQPHDKRSLQTARWHQSEQRATDEGQTYGSFFHRLAQIFTWISK